MTTLRRPPIEAKTSFYQATGSGRDGYILTNSGGLYKNFSLPKLSPSSGAFPKGSPVRNNKPRIEAKGIFYYSDGSGRDYYVVRDNGGLCTSPDSHKNLYWNTLRSYDRVRSPKVNAGTAPDYFTWAQVYRPTTTNEQSRMKSLVERLSSPRKKVALKKATQHSVFKLKNNHLPKDPCS